MVFGAGLLVMVTVAAVLVPRLGAVGAATALVSGYAVSAALFVFVLRKTLSWRDWFARNPSEVA